MDKIKLVLDVPVYQRMREMIIAGGKWPATGEAGIHSASQLLLHLDQQVQAQGQAKANGKARTQQRQEANGRDSDSLPA